MAAFASLLEGAVPTEPSKGKSKIKMIFEIAAKQVLNDPSLRLSAEQRKCILDISRCRTLDSGFNLEVCSECGYNRLHYNSCGNRNCPLCNSIQKEIWIDARQSETIDAPYYHTVFTCPHELVPLFMANKKLLFSMFHRCVGESVLDLCADPRHLGAVPGIIQVLHTWNQELEYHPHIHAVISGGGLTPDGKLKILPEGSFFIAESIMSAMLRGKFLDALNVAYTQKRLNLPGRLDYLNDPNTWYRFKSVLYRAKWVAHVEETFNGRGNALQYLGRYIFKIAITDSRIVSVSEQEVVFTARGDDKRQSRPVHVTPLEFVKRFLLHVLPKGFQKVRYYGFLNNRFKKNNLTRIFNLQGFRRYLRKYKDCKPAEIILDRWNHDITVCPRCNARTMNRVLNVRAFHQLE